MDRFAVSRIVAAVVLCLGSFTVPAAALLHGAAHQHEAEHRREHEHESGNGATALGQEPVPTVAPAEHHADHPHVGTDGGMRSRVEGLALLRPELVRVAAAREIRVAARADLPYASLPRADPATGPPPRLRAPPIA